MILLDSNIVIYTTKPGFDSLQRFLSDNDLSVSIISYVEVLGYSKLSLQDRAALEEFFASIPLLTLSPDVADTAVLLRQNRKMSLGDSIIAATALVNDLPLITNNQKDFEWIAGLTLLNPAEN